MRRGLPRLSSHNIPTWPHSTTKIKRKRHKNIIGNPWLYPDWWLTIDVADPSTKNYLIHTFIPKLTVQSFCLLPLSHPPLCCIYTSNFSICGQETTQHSIFPHQNIIIAYLPWPSRLLPFSPLLCPFPKRSVCVSIL